MPISGIPFIVKVCGVTTLDDAQAAIDAGANALGFNFYANSPRYISFEQAAGIISNLQGEFLRVGVFVNPSSHELTAASPFLDVFQIHGESAVSHAVLPIWRAANPNAIPLADKSDESVQAWLLDTVTPAFGGSGRTFDWSLAARFPNRVIVAGGLDADNVAEAIRITNPWGVDSCSRLESAPGRKDHARVAAFVANAKDAFHARQTVTI